MFYKREKAKLVCDFNLLDRYKAKVYAQGRSMGVRLPLEIQEIAQWASENHMSIKVAWADMKEFVNYYVKRGADNENHTRH